jgi:galactokinase
MYLFFVDLAGRKDTVRILQCLRDAYPAGPDVQEALGPANERIVRRAFQALSQADAGELGELMTQAQANFDRCLAPCCPGELASPLLHQVLGLESIARHVWGGKCVGSGGDGTAQFIARSEQDRQAAMAKITAALPPMRCFPLNIVPMGGA